MRRRYIQTRPYNTAGYRAAVHYINRQFNYKRIVIDIILFYYIYNIHT